MKIGISGLGLIGGSIALQLKKVNPDIFITGYDKSKQHQNIAFKAGFIDQLATHGDELLESDLIILAMPVNSILQMLPYYLDRISNQIITDTGSFKIEHMRSCSEPSQAQQLCRWAPNGRNRAQRAECSRAKSISRQVLDFKRRKQIGRKSIAIHQGNHLFVEC